MMANPRHTRTIPKGILVGLLLVGALTAAAPPTAAQGPLSCLNCDFELVTVEWNGTADPGASTGGTFEIRNTGESRDRYSITASADNASWTVETDPAETAEVPPGSGVFAEEDNTVRFAVRVLVPADAPANAKATLTVRVESQNEEGLDAETTTEVRAKQVYGWTLECTPHVTAQKSKRADVTLNATNTGNGRDRAEVAFTPVEGLAIDAPTDFDAAAGATKRQVIEVGVGLRADDGTYSVRWDLRSSGAPDVRASCTTMFEVVGGDGGGTDGNGENEDSPAPASALVVLLALGLVALGRKRSA